MTLWIDLLVLKGMYMMHQIDYKKALPCRYGIAKCKHIE